ncbi:hypothetical protein [Corynebacterium cystitidis]|uniref:hypothetical protein n=1 Tax=Corynebacterium cystitidis TaxID=35757 RepID=UPI00211E3DAA|nr:hypothetical protein [Corynebacterium cystitidis]
MTAEDIPFDVIGITLDAQIVAWLMTIVASPNPQPSCSWRSCSNPTGWATSACGHHGVVHPACDFPDRLRGQPFGKGA